MKYLHSKICNNNRNTEKNVGKKSPHWRESSDWRKMLFLLFSEIGKLRGRQGVRRGQLFSGCWWNRRSRRIWGFKVSTISYSSKKCIKKKQCLTLKKKIEMKRKIECKYRSSLAYTAKCVFKYKCVYVYMSVALLFWQRVKSGILKIANHREYRI